MELLELFTGRKKKLARGHLKNLIEVAYSDGEFDSVEVDYLLSLAGRFNISEAEKQTNNLLKIVSIYFFQMVFAMSDETSFIRQGKTLFY